jgi:hypothetical protein
MDRVGHLVHLVAMGRLGSMTAMDWIASLSPFVVFGIIVFGGVYEWNRRRRGK